MTKLTNDEYAARVAAGDYPDDRHVMLGDVFEDARGSISIVLLTQIGSVARIHSVAGAVRANHYHRTDFHYALVEDGQVLYFERAIGDTIIPEPTIFGPGQMFFTPPLREHAMLFSEATVIYTFSRRKRDHESHESDVVRVDFVTPAVAADVLRRLIR